MALSSSRSPIASATPIPAPSASKVERGRPRTSASYAVVIDETTGARGFDVGVAESEARIMNTCDAISSSSSARRRAFTELIAVIGKKSFSTSPRLSSRSSESGRVVK